MRYPKKATEENLRFILDNYAKMSVKELADKFGVKINTIGQWVHRLRKLGYTLPFKNKSVFKSLAEKNGKNIS